MYNIFDKILIGAECSLQLAKHELIC